VRFGRVRHPRRATDPGSGPKFLAAPAADSAPDVQQMGAPDLIEYAEQNALLPLDDTIKRDKWDMKQYFDFAVQQTS
jgi:hypothetical protein